MQKTERDAVVEHATRIRHLVHNPSSFLTELVVQQQQYHCIEWLCHFDIFSHVTFPPNVSTYEDVAAKAGVPTSTLKAVTRMAITAGVLQETSPGCPSHNSLSASFVNDVHVRTQLLHMFRQTVPIMTGLIGAVEKWGETTESNQTAYNLVNKTELPFFQHLKAQPELGANFEAFMKSRAVSHQGSSAEHLLEAFDWKLLGEATVVDVGGSSGSTAIMLATAYPRPRLVVEDLPEPIESATSRLSGLPDDIKGRIEVINHDFFNPQPKTSADVYLLRTIIHDWADADAVKILQSIAKAMTPSSRLLIMDMVLPEPGSEPRTFEATLRQKDLTMIQAFNAKKRESEEWRALLDRVVPKLTIRSIKRPTGSELSVIEAVLDRQDETALVNNKNHEVVNGS